ncbi:glycosyltransferase family 2 protein [Chthonobacter albigriseus]|uniref:glycosyltransferase family 2 protein n=1 Tax=Chthonobacter albigriseus TaxID=1683161 RepID=UPI003140A15F
MSIIIPAYNAETYLARTLRTAVHQSYRTVEILIVNDGSTDSTLSIAQEFAASDPRIRILNTPNGGVAAARNAGLAAAAGELVAFLDADDLWHPEKIRRQVDALRSCNGPEWGAVFTLHRRIDEFDDVISQGATVIYSGDILARHFYFKSVGNGSALLVRRDAALAVGGYDSSYRAAGIGGCEDFDFEMKIVARYKVAFVPEFLVGYRVYEGSMSSNRARMAEGMIATTRNHLEANPQLSEETRRWIMAGALHYARVNFLRARRFDRFFASTWELARLDPPVLLRMGKHFVMNLIGSLNPIRLLRNREPEPRIPYLEADPLEFASRGPIGRFQTARFQRLCEVDESGLSRALPDVADMAPAQGSPGTPKLGASVGSSPRVT